MSSGVDQGIGRHCDAYQRSSPLRSNSGIAVGNRRGLGYLLFATRFQLRAACRRFSALAVESSSRQAETTPRSAPPRIDEDRKGERLRSWRAPEFHSARTGALKATVHGPRDRSVLDARNSRCPPGLFDATIRCRREIVLAALRLCVAPHHASDIERLRVGAGRRALFEQHGLRPKARGRRRSPPGSQASGRGCARRAPPPAP
jgi:hypothetical protein